MDIAALLVSAGTLLVAAASPGPGIAARAVRLLNRAGGTVMSGAAVAVATK
jgi:threonine/homoserine/homoserine lactone efflux protein